MVRCVFLILTGYFGVKRSSRGLLLCFFLLSLFSCGLVVFSSIYEITTSEIEIGEITLEFFEALYFLVAMHYSRFLWKESRERSLLDAPPDGSLNESGYTMLGINMLDMKVLKATQLLFTSLAIIGSIFGIVIVHDFQGATKDKNALIGWLMCVIFLVSLGYSGYFGVKRSSSNLLCFFSIISGSLGALFFATTTFTAFLCIPSCLAIVMFGYGITGVLWIAVSNAFYLMRKASTGTALSQPVKEQVGGTEATVIGTELDLKEEPECIA